MRTDTSAAACDVPRPLGRRQPAKHTRHSLRRPATAWAARPASAAGARKCPHDPTAPGAPKVVRPGRQHAGKPATKIDMHHTQPAKHTRRSLRRPAAAGARLKVTPCTATQTSLGKNRTEMSRRRPMASCFSNLTTRLDAQGLCGAENTSARANRGLGVEKGVGEWRNGGKRHF